jgi:uncharacterized protein YukE
MGQAAQLTEIADSLRTTAGVYTSTGEDLDTTTLALTGVVQNLLTNWKGASPVAFANACNKAWNDAGKISGSLSSTAAALTALAGSIESNIGPINNYETQELITVDKSALASAQLAASTAQAAIAAAVAQQAAAIEAAAGEVGVCSTAEGGPWGEKGLQLNATQQGSGENTPGFLKGAPGFIKANWKTAFILGTANTLPYMLSDALKGKDPFMDKSLYPIWAANVAQGFAAKNVFTSSQKLVATTYADKFFNLIGIADPSSRLVITQSLIGSGIIGDGVVLTPWLVTHLWNVVKDGWEDSEGKTTTPTLPPPQIPGGGIYSQNGK